MVLYSSVDGGYAWIVLACAMVNSLLVGIFAGGIGVLMVEFTHYFSISRTKSALAGACVMFIGSLLSWFLSSITKKIGVKVTAYLGVLMTVLGHFIIFTLPIFWVVLVCYSLITSTGIFLTYQTIFTINQLYFERNRSLTSGLLAFGLSIGSMIGPLLTQILIEEYGFRGCILLAGGVHLQGLLSASLIRPVQRLRDATSSYQPDLYDKSTNPNETQSSLRKNVKRCFSMWTKDYALFSIYLIAVTTVVIGQSFVMMFTPMVAESIHIGARERALLVTFMGATGCIIRPLVGLIANSGCVTRDMRPVLYGLSGVLAGVLILLSTLCTNFLHMAFFTCLFGMLSGASYGLLSSVMGDLLSPNHAETGSGLIVLCHALAYLIVYPLSGWMIDYSGHARYACYTFGILEISGSLLCAHLPLIRKKLQSHNKRSTHVEMPDLVS